MQLAILPSRTSRRVHICGGKHSVRNWPKRIFRVIVVVGIQLVVAALHFVTGSSYGGAWPVFINSYLIDILLPFAFYFLLTLRPMPFKQPWLVSAGLVFMAAAAAELAQAFGLPVLGRTFDPLDFVAYAAGAGLAMVVDRLIFARVFAFWQV